MLASGCSTTQQMQVKANETADKEYSLIYLDIDLDKSEDTEAVIDAMAKQLERRGLQTSLSVMTSSVSNQSQTDTVLLKIDEIDRRTVTVRYLHLPASVPGADARAQVF